MATYTEVMATAEAQSGGQIRRLEGCTGVSYVTMVHPKTGKVVKIQADPNVVLRSLVKGFVLITSTEGDMRCKLVWGSEKEIIPDPILVMLRKLDKQIGTFTEYCEALNERQGIHGEGKDIELQQPRKVRRKRTVAGGNTKAK